MNIYGVGDVNLSNMMASENALTKGFHQVSLTNWSTTAVPQISLGSLVECDGALYQSTVNETIGGSTSDGTLYIKSVPSSNTVTFEFSTTAPTWDVIKQGWYTSTTSNERYLEYLITRSSNNYYKDNYFHQQQVPEKRLFTLTMSTDTVTVSTGVKLGFNTATDDTLSEWNSTGLLFLCKKSGYANISINLSAYCGASIGHFIDIRKNGSNLYYSNYGNSVSDRITGGCSNKVISLNTGDYLEFYCALNASNFYANYSYIQITDY